MDDKKIESNFEKMKRSIKKTSDRTQMCVNVINTTHQKIEIGDEQLFNMLKEQQETINALTSILIDQRILKDEEQIKDTINAKKVMDKITQVEPTKDEINQWLREEAGRLYKLLYKNNDYYTEEDT